MPRSWADIRDCTQECTCSRCSSHHNSSSLHWPQHSRCCSRRMYERCKWAPPSWRRYCSRCSHTSVWRGCPSTPDHIPGHTRGLYACSVEPGSQDMRHRCCCRARTSIFRWSQGRCTSRIGSLWVEGQRQGERKQAKVSDQGWQRNRCII